MVDDELPDIGIVRTYSGDPLELDSQLLPPDTEGGEFGAAIAVSGDGLIVSGGGEDVSSDDQVVTFRKSAPMP